MVNSPPETPVGTAVVELPRGRRLTIRPITPDDTEGLTTLFRSLYEEDLYCRFFQARVPGSKVLQRMTRIAERGGIGLVASLEAADGTSRVVAEASCEPLPNGDGELGITVAPTSRGWLGPYLLAVLLQAAAQRGVPNLEADILVENRRMLALIQARGYVTADHYDQPAIVRVVIGASHRLPTWQSHDDHPRVLVEAPGGRWYAEQTARAAHLNVLVCPGPLRAPSQCPAIAGEPCPLALGADVIFDAVPPTTPGGRALLDSHSALHAGVPVCVELPPSAASQGPRSPRHRTDDDAALVVQLIQRVLSEHAGSPGEVGHSKRQ